MNCNALLQRLPAAQRERLLARLKPVALSAGTTLALQGDPMQALLFPLSGCLSLQRGLAPQSPLQLLLVGRESCVGALLLLGPARHALRVEVLESGETLHLGGRALRDSLADSPGLRRLLAEAVRAEVQQLAQAALCGRWHALQPRLARWLLERSERNGSPRVDATQSLMARLLGVRREAVTAAANGLQHEGAVRYHRGHLEILDRSRLVAGACGCWRARKA